MKYKHAIVAAYFKSEGLPPYVTELKFNIDRKWRFDFAWMEERVALEVEGGVWIGGGHTRGSGFTKDLSKYNSAALLGWRVFRVTPDQLCRIETVKMIRSALGIINIKRI